MRSFFSFLFLLLFLCCYLSANSQSQWTHGRLKVTADGHYLQYEDGTPFFWLGDTGWELFHRLRKEEINGYLENRREKGFNVIQAVILAEFNGLKRPNQYDQLPLVDLDPTKPNEKYFELIDYTVQLALQKNMFLGLLPTWGDKVTKLWGEGPVIFNEDNAYVYGKWLGQRYKKYPNIVWILGGDRPPIIDSADYRPIWRAMATGISEGADGKAIFTYHTWGGHSTSEYFHNENWLSINSMQSGHGSGHDVAVWKMVEHDWNLKPAKPTLDDEPNYEDHPVNPWPKWNPSNGYFRDYDVRKQIYRSVFAGACGATYGHHAVWQFLSAREDTINHADRYWTEAIDRPGAFQVGYLKRLIESHAAFDRVPDQSLILDGQGEQSEYAVAFRERNHQCAMVYLPVGKKIVVNTRFVGDSEITISWFNPRNGKIEKKMNLRNEGSMSFDPPTTGSGNDWVLIIEKI